MDQNLVTVRETFLAKNQFIIPDYQRGYKWTVAEVRKLLEDVNGFKPGNGLDYYCLQNLTLVRSANKTNILKIVDGQQRLMTSLIIIAYLQHRQIDNLPHLPDGQLSFGTIQEGTTLEQNATEHKPQTRQETTQPFLSKWIITGKIWADASNDILTNPVWTSSENGEKLGGDLRPLFDQWLKGKPENIYNHSDIFHMYCAAMTIAVFFQDNENANVDDFANRFLDKVKFLHNIVDEESTTAEDQAGVREAEIFSKINGFRVPLDGADLLRAIFITYAVDKNALDCGFTEREVRLNEARVKLGLELDEMGAWWQDENHRKYFAMFDQFETEKALFNPENYPISTLYRLFAESERAKTISVSWFEKYQHGIPTLYCKIRQFHSILKDWYEDCTFYHYAGFLRKQCGWDLCGIYDLLKNSYSRSTFYRELKKRMFLSVTRGKNENSKPDASDTLSFPDKLHNLTAAILAPSARFDANNPMVACDIIDATPAENNKLKTHNWFDEEVYSVEKVLVLLDVIAFTKLSIKKDSRQNNGRHDNSPKMRTPLSNHLDPEFFSCDGEDKEHVFPQTPIGGKDRNNPGKLYEKMREYWGLVSDRRDSVSDKTNNLLDAWTNHWRMCEARMSISDDDKVFPLAFKNEKDSKTWIDWLFAKEGREKEAIRRINEFVIQQCKIDLNSIGNIVMLDAHINRGYGNNYFYEKRKEIWAKYRACQPVRLHTYRVFAKEFPGEELDLKEWDQAAIKANREAIKNEIESFFDELFPKQEAVQ